MLIRYTVHVRRVEFLCSRAWLLNLVYCLLSWYGHTRTSKRVGPLSVVRHLRSLAAVSQLWLALTLRMLL